jgi:DNA repair protein RadA/Sms
VNGVDASRVAMLLAVLERRCGLKISSSDVYVSTVGGIRLQEPGADLAIALAIASAVKDQALPATLAAIGEISLAGEIRPVSSATQRAAEARRLGFSGVVDGASGALREAIRAAFAQTAPGDRVDVPAF